MLSSRAAPNTILDPSGSTPIGAVVDEATMKAIDKGRIESSDANKVLYPLTNKTSRTWNVDLNDILCIYSARAAAAYSIYRNNGVNGNTGGRPAVLAQVGGVPNLVDPKEMYAHITDDDLKRRIRQMDTLTNFTFGGISLGGYNDQEGYAKSAVHSGFPMAIKGDATLSVLKIGGRDIPEFTPLVLALPDLPETGERVSDPYNPEGSRIPFTLKPWDPEDVVAHVYGCLAKDDYALTNGGKLTLAEQKKRKLIEVTRNEARNGAMFRNGLWGMTIATVLMLKELGIDFGKSSAEIVDDMKKRDFDQGLLKRLNAARNENFRGLAGFETEVNRLAKGDADMYLKHAIDDITKSISTSLEESSQHVGRSLGRQPNSNPNYTSFDFSF